MGSGGDEVAVNSFNATLSCIGSCHRRVHVFPNVWLLNRLTTLVLINSDIFYFFVALVSKEQILRSVSVSVSEENE